MRVTLTCPSAHLKHRTRKRKEKDARNGKSMYLLVAVHASNPLSFFLQYINWNDRFRQGGVEQLTKAARFCFEAFTGIKACGWEDRWKVGILAEDRDGSTSPGYARLLARSKQLNGSGKTLPSQMLWNIYIYRYIMLSTALAVSANSECHILALCS